ncbi:hypothetical protein EXIGLDRAFT_153725 [Exidia glandulosa HHB12029]|uniref:Uncharacterized protein n=1 Tax=Exidia glandulosa HHB12029 TaxID=1314781 RepID=A0A166BS66_EXIGL|nr:hypothetical protein EXIGLDRAFT_153725 [Exidia glandulosa HHB12029]
MPKARRSRGWMRAWMTWATVVDSGSSNVARVDRQGTGCDEPRMGPAYGTCRHMSNRFCNWQKVFAIVRHSPLQRSARCVGARKAAIIRQIEDINLQVSGRQMERVCT